MSANGRKRRHKNAPEIIDDETVVANSGMMIVRVSDKAVRVWIARAGGTFQISKRRQHMNAILLASAGVVILLVGAGIGFWVGRSGVGGSKARVEKAEAELEEYKRNVSEHFGQTAAHFHAIGKQYRELYEHMASGAQVLCEPDESGKQLLFAPGADAVTSNVEDASAEADAEAAVRPPVDYAEQSIASEAADAPEAAGEPTDEQPAEEADKGESSAKDVADEPVSETAAESQPDAKAEEGKRTIH